MLVTPQAHHQIQVLEKQISNAEVWIGVAQSCVMVAAMAGASNAELNRDIFRRIEEVYLMKQNLAGLVALNNQSPTQEKTMAINVEVAKSKISDEYPCVKQHSPTGAIVLMSSRTEGTVLAPISVAPSAEDPPCQIGLGYHSDRWNPTAFIPWSGTIKLEQ